MPTGGQIYEDFTNAGTILIDYSGDSNCLFLGLISPSGSGSITVPEFADGQPFARPMGSSAFFAPNVTITGNVLAWVGAMRIIYGVYG